jgi:hypothetical protein
MLNLVNQLFKIYLKVNKLHLCKPLIREVAHHTQIAKNNQIPIGQWCGSVTFWYGSGSADPCL